MGHSEALGGILWVVCACVCAYVIVRMSIIAKTNLLLQGFSQLKLEASLLSESFLQDIKDHTSS